MNPTNMHNCQILSEILDLYFVYILGLTKNEVAYIVSGPDHWSTYCRNVKVKVYGGNILPTHVLGFQHVSTSSPKY